MISPQKAATVLQDICDLDALADGSDWGRLYEATADPDACGPRQRDRLLYLHFMAAALIGHDDVDMAFDRLLAEATANTVFRDLLKFLHVNDMPARLVPAIRAAHDKGFNSPRLARWAGIAKRFAADDDDADALETIGNEVMDEGALREPVQGPTRFSYPMPTPAARRTDFRASLTVTGGGGADLSAHRAIYERLMGDAEGQIEQPEARELRNVFMNARGQVWDAEGKGVVNFGHVIKTDRAESLRRLADGSAPRFAQGTMPVKYTTGLFYWLCMAFPGLSFKLDPAAAEMPIVLPADSRPYKVETLELCGLGDQVLSFEGDYAYFDRLIYCPRIDLAWGVTSPLYERLLAGARARGGAIARPELLYLSRRKVDDNRSLANEEALEEALSGLGFAIIHPGETPFVEQIRLAAGARLVLSMHGGAMANIVFCAPRTRIMELMLVDPGHTAKQVAFFHLARQRKLDFWIHMIMKRPGSEKLWDADVPAIVDHLSDWLARDNSVVPEVARPGDAGRVDRAKPRWAARKVQSPAVEGDQDERPQAVAPAADRNPPERLRSSDAGSPDRTGPSRSAKAVHALVAAAAERGDWRKVVDLTADHDLLIASPRLVKLRLIAAMECGDQAAILSCIEALTDPMALPGPSLDKLLSTTLERLEGGGFPDQAWHLLTVLPGPLTGLQMAALRRLADGHPDPARRAVVKARSAGMADLEPDAGPRPAASDGPHRIRVFPGRPSREPAAAGTVDFIESAKVGPNHKALFQSLDGAFRDLVADRSAPPEVVEYRDVLVNRDGLIWRPDGLVLHGRRREGVPLATATGVPEIALAATGLTNTRGFDHWYLDCLLRLGWAMPPHERDLPILINDDARAFQSETHRLAGVAEARLVPVGDALFCRRLQLGRAALAHLPAWDHFAALYETLADGAAAEAQHAAAPRAIYLSRRDSKRRVLENEAELEGALSGLGIVPLVFGAMPLAAQIAAIRGADLIVGPHGAGLAHLIAARPGTRVLELMPIAGAHHSLRFNFARLSLIRGHHHTMWLEAINPVTQQWSVDVGAVAALAGRLFAAL